MCRAASADGITHMVATPHANDRWHYDREYLQGLLAQLQERVGDAIKLSLGCDFHLSYENIQDAVAHPTRYVIDGTRYLLVEFSNFSIPQQTNNPILRESLQRVVEWAEQGCIVQVTGSSLTGFWGDRARKAALWLLEHEAAHVLATDAHEMEKRVPILSKSRDVASEICGEEIANALVDQNPRAIIENQPLPYFPRPAGTGYRKGSK